MSTSSAKPGTPASIYTFYYSLSKFGSTDFYIRIESLIGSTIHQGHRVASFWFGSKLMILTGDAKINEHILRSSKSNRKDEDIYGHFNKFADGVFSRNGDGWSDLRKWMNKFLQPKAVVENHFGVMAAKSEDLCQALDSKCNKGIFDIHSYMQRSTLFITYEALMGIPEALAEHLRFDFHWPKRIATICFRLILNVQYRFKWVFFSSKIKKEMVEIQDALCKFGRRLIKCRTDILAAHGQNPEDPGFEPECYTDLTMKQALKEHQDGLTMPFDLILAGYDTSSVSLSSACMFLAMHPEYQERAYQEQIEVMGDTLRAPTYEETAKMDYLGMVYLETLRHVGVPAVQRQLSSEIIVGDYIFPEGASIYVSLHGANMNTDYWEKPTEFYPDHFLPETVSNRPKGAFLPFSAGARVCPGKDFALISGKIILSMLLRRFHFATTLKFSELEYEYGFMLESAKGYPIQLTRRTQRNAAARH